MEFQAEESSHEGEQEMGEGNQKAQGFQPMEDPVEDKEKKRKREESEQSKALKREIIKMVARYPELELRTGKQIMDKLNEMGEDELVMVRDNCINDLAEIRGTPAASFATFCVTQPVDRYLLPGYTEQCLSDLELKRDIETEMILLLGELSNRVNIFFRLLNNAYITWKKSKGEHFEDLNATSAKPKFNREDEGSCSEEEGDSSPAYRTSTSREPPW